MLHKSGFLNTPIVLPCPTMKGLVEYIMYVSQGEMIMFGGGA